MRLPITWFIIGQWVPVISLLFFIVVWFCDNLEFRSHHENASPNNFTSHSLSFVVTCVYYDNNSSNKRMFPRDRSFFEIYIVAFICLNHRDRWSFQWNLSRPVDKIGYHRYTLAYCVLLVTSSIIYLISSIKCNVINFVKGDYGASRLMNLYQINWNIIIINIIFNIFSFS